MGGRVGGLKGGWVGRRVGGWRRVGRRSKRQVLRNESLGNVRSNSRVSDNAQCRVSTPLSQEEELRPLAVVRVTWRFSSFDEDREAVAAKCSVDVIWYVHVVLPFPAPVAPRPSERSHYVSVWAAAWPEPRLLICVTFKNDGLSLP